ncbi:MAG: Crp/Fnr family transcriptional regulator [Candidatus Bipolaricaulia bacterium]
MAVTNTLRCSDGRSGCTCLLAPLNESELGESIRLFNTIIYRPGETLFEQGDLISGCYIICQGKLKLAQRTEHGQRYLIKFLGPGDLLYTDLFSGEVWHSAYAQVLEETVTRFIERDEFRKLCDRCPSLYSAITQELAREVVWLQRRLTSIAYAEPRRRLAEVILNLIEKFGTEQEAGWTVDLRLTRRELAEMIGVSERTVVRHLKRLTANGWISFERHRITIPDDGRLRDLAGFS